VHIKQLTVVVPGVGDVVGQALDGALAADSSLAAETHKGEHGQAGVLLFVHDGVCVCVCAAEVCVCARTCVVVPCLKDHTIISLSIKHPATTPHPSPSNQAQHSTPPTQTHPTHLDLLQLRLGGLHAHGVKRGDAQRAALAHLLEGLVALGLHKGEDGDLDERQGLGVEGVLLRGGGLVDPTWPC